MAYTEAQKNATMKYMKKTYDRFDLKLAKGQKEEIQAHAVSMDESLNAFIKRAIDETIERDKQKAPHLQ